ncbi:unnamed protein product [Orchesella dallaii]|uniref:Tenascin-X n=1 Tax=Orchesella dallaii TaxID=48710 RepID=A0ABP1PPN4_9HEXA
MESLLLRRKLFLIWCYNIPLCFLLLMLDAPAQVNGQTQLRPGTYGDRCSTTNPCEREANLVCINNFCQCSGSDEVFDDIRERCAVQEGKRCSPPPFQYGEYNPCVLNAYCSVDKKTCTCAKHAFPDGKGHCIKRRYFNETCSINKQCDGMRYLSCVDGRCQCEKANMFDEYYQMCKRKVGDFCLISRDCVKNAECVDSKCVCGAKYVENSDKTCALSFGQKCSASPEEFPCSDTYFACINGVCQCKNPSYELYDIKSNTCLGLVGSLCNLFMSNNRQPLRLKNCVPNAECVRRDLSALSQCECEKGFVETVSGMCQLPYGAACEKNTALFGDALTPQCDETVPLACKNSRCDCENPNDIYDPMDKSCRRMIGGQCSPSTPCVANSECVKEKCKCQSGFLPNFRGICDEDNQILPQQHIYDVVSPPPYTMYRSTPIFE